MRKRREEKRGGKGGTGGEERKENVKMGRVKGRKENGTLQQHAFCEGRLDCNGSTESRLHIQRDNGHTPHEFR